MSERKPIVVVGSINVDLVATAARMPSTGETITASGFQTHPGGKGANQAVGVARLDYPVRLIGRVGQDAFEPQLQSYLHAAGVDIAGISASDGPTGVAMIVVSDSGANSIVVAPGANATLTPEALEDSLPVLRTAGMVLAQLEIPLETVVYLASFCAREDIPLILDPAPARELPPGLLRQVAWFTPNQTEAAFYLAGQHGGSHAVAAPEAAKRLLSNGCHGVVLKMGAGGSYLQSAEYAGRLVPAFSADAVDTTAAGDAFNAAFATGLMLGKSPLDSAVFASAAAAISVTRRGAQPSLPSMAEVQAFLKG